MVREQIDVVVISGGEQIGGKYIIHDADDFTSINTEKQVKTELAGIIADAIFKACGEEVDGEGRSGSKNHRIVITVEPR